MAYKGDDLDLRSPQSSGGRLYPAGGPGTDAYGAPLDQRSRSRMHRFQAPGWLEADDTLLACCNHAYEIASANGSREIMLEHLIHAFTRVPDAAQLLETNGFHVMALRRESAGIIADDLPISASHSGLATQPSDDFNTVLHRASTRAGQMGRAATVPDVLQVLMRYEGETSAVDLLRKHQSGWQVEEVQRSLPLRPMPRQRDFPPEARVLDYEQQASSSYAREPDRGEWRMIDRSEMLGMWQGIEQRLNGLERGIGAIAADSNRDAQALRIAVDNRLGALEKSLEGARSEGGAPGVDAMLGARLARIEKMQEALLNQRSSLGALEGTLNEKLQHFEKLFEQNKIDPSKLPTGIVERLQSLERNLENKLAEQSRTGNVLGERLNRIEKAIEDDTKAEADLVHRLNRVQQQLESMAKAMPAGVVDRMQALEQSFENKINEGMRSWGGIGERLQSLERSLSAQRAEVQHLQSGIATHVKEAVAGQAEQFSSLATRLPSGIVERLEGIERNLARVQAPDLADIRNQLARLAGTEQTLTSAIDQWRLDNTGDLGIISNRLEALEHAALRPQEMLETLNARIQALGGRSVHTASTGGTVSAAPRTHHRGFWRWLFGLN